MAFGRHWEWRGFGTIGRELRAAVESLPTKFPAAQELVDEYLWVPGSAINVKLRTGDLKFKRLVARSGRLERWLEDPEENYALPIAPPVVQKLAEELRIRLRRCRHRASIARGSSTSSRAPSRTSWS
jgi:hypothetical protein